MVALEDVLDKKLVRLHKLPVDLLHAQTFVKGSVSVGLQHCEIIFTEFLDVRLLHRLNRVLLSEVVLGCFSVQDFGDFVLD